MADKDSSQEKTEDATPKRIREARKKGQVAKSKDLNTIVILIAAFVFIASFKGNIWEQAQAASVESFQIASAKDIHVNQMLYYVERMFIYYVKAILPFLITIMGIALAVGFLQVGPIFATEPLKPQFKRINMIENVKNMAKMTTFVELLKNIVKMSLIFTIAYFVVKTNVDMVVSTVSASLVQSMEVASMLLTSFLTQVFMLFIIIAIIDLMVQRHQFKKDMKMSKDEVKREYKQDEGDPLIKSVRKQLYQELVMSDVKQSVSVSDFVVTNPTQVAVAVKYDEAEMSAPQVMAGGQRLMADAIREFAEEFNIPVLRNVPLAWALLELEIGDEVPEDLYQAIAELLVVVYKMKTDSESTQIQTPIQTPNE
jgi:flagellar biosynthesis protein FlhB